MRTKVVLCLALVAGIIVLFFRSTPPGTQDNSQDPIPSTTSPTSGAVALQTPAAIASKTPVISPSVDWNQPAREPEFSAFQGWVNRYQAAGNDAAAKASLELEGQALARTRLAAMGSLIERDPERALELAVPNHIRGLLPDSIRNLTEEPVNTLGDYQVIASLPAAGVANPPPPVVRAAIIGGETHEVFTYGKGLERVTKQNVPLSGISVDVAAVPNRRTHQIFQPTRRMALAASSTREIIDAQLLAPILQSKPACPESGEPTVVAAEQGPIIEAFCGPAHLKLWAAAGDAGLSTPDGAENLPTAASSYTEGRKRMLLMRPIWSDYTGGMTTNDALTHFQNFSNYMFEMSQGKLVLAPLGKGSDITPAMLLPGGVAEYDNTGLGRLYTTSRDVAAANFGYSLADYDFTYVCTGSRPAASYAGLAYVGGVGFHLANGYWDSGVSTHEFGHNLGLNHAHFWDTGAQSIIGNGQNVEYGDNNDPMGGGASPNSFNSRYRNYLGWIPNSDFVDLAVGGSGLYRLYSFDLDNSSGLRGLRFARDGSQNYWVNFRQRKTDKKALMNGAQLLWTGNGNQGSYLLDVRLKGNADNNAIVIGRTFSDTARGFHITPVGKGHTFPESLDVRVNIGSFPGNQPPIARVSASLPTAAANQTITFTAAAWDTDGDSLAYYWDFGDGDYSVDNSPVVSRAFSTAGEYVVQCTVSDMKGGTARQSVIVRVGNPNTFRIGGHVLDQQNRPLGGIKVSSSSGRSVFTDSDGGYTLVGLSAGSHEIEAIEPVGGALAFAHPTFNHPIVVGPNFSGADLVAVPGSLNIYTPLVAKAAGSWRFLDNGTDQGTAWRDSLFNDESWSTGTGPLGYPYGGLINTVISYGADANLKHPTYYFRRSFVVANPATYTNLLLETLRDDSVAVYLNGTEIFRDNLVSNATYNTLANDNSPADSYLQTTVSRNLLVPGTNYLAAEVHQVLRNSSDVAFDVALSGLSVSNASGFKYVYISSPEDGSVFIEPTSLTVTAGAFDGAGSISRVEFFRHGIKIGEDTTPPYSVVWSQPVSVATHLLTAVATLSSGPALTSAPVRIVVTNRAQLTVEMKSLSPYADFGIPTSLLVEAIVTPGAAAISNVQFRLNGQVFGTDSTAPYSATLNQLETGSYSLSAIATDEAGNVVISSPIAATFVRPLSGTQLVSFGDAWRYLDDGSNQGTAWTMRNFDDRSWLSGPGRLGYGGDGEITVVNFGPNANQRYVTTYFRRAFQVANPAAIGRLRLRLIRDDGVVVYLNGVEVFRDNLPSGQISWNSLATEAIGGADEVTPIEVLLSTNGLAAGTNVIAVELHQSAPNSSDLGFDLSLVGLNWFTSSLSLIEPANQAHFNTPADIALEAYAPVQGTMMFLANGVIIGQATTLPFTCVWSNAPIGEHILRAVMSANSGIVQTSSPVTITVGNPPPRITPASATLIGSGVTWRYWDNVTAVTPGWQTLGFDDTTWPTGVSRFGWGLDGEITTLTEGRITHYFRRQFTVPSPGLFTELLLRLARDDGAVVYLNGLEVFRSNMPQGPVIASTLASSSVNTPDETTYFEHWMPTAGSGLVSGLNVLAVEIHQGSATSSDCGFDLQLFAYGSSAGRVYLATPAVGSTYVSPATITMEAFARGNGSAAVTGVEFFAGTTRLGEVTAAPWRFTWSNAPLGTFQITARSSDSLGGSAISEPLEITVGRTPVATTFVASNVVWKYLDAGANAGTSWTATNYNDASWKSGQTRLGYGNDGEVLPAVSYGSSTANKYITTYFRRRFVVPEGAVYTNLVFRLVRDDGAVVWLNGRELYRSNMTNGTINYLTRAIDAVSGPDEQTFFVTLQPATHLFRGTNTLAVEVHQNDPGSSDLGFNLELTGTGYEDDTTPPLLLIQYSDELVELRWPATATGWRVYVAPAVETPANAWAPAAGTPLQVGGQNVLTLSPEPANRFFRLGRP